MFLAGVVSQEPVLFGTTIIDNVRYGREGVTKKEIEQAAREANIHKFLSTLPEVQIIKKHNFFVLQPLEYYTGISHIQKCLI